MIGPSKPWPSMTAKPGEASWPESPSPEWNLTARVDGGAGKGLRMLFLQKLSLQREEQRAPFVTPHKVTPLLIISPTTKHTQPPHLVRGTVKSLLLPGLIS